MAGEIKLSDRASVVISEKLVPKLQKNFWRISNKPWLRMLGVDTKNDGGPDAMGTVNPRLSNVSKLLVDHTTFKVVHKHTAFGGGVQAADELESLVNGGYKAARSQANLKTVQGQFVLSQQAIDAMSNNPDSLVNEIVENAMGAVHRMHKDMNRQLVGNIEGILCYIDGTTSSSTTVTVKSNASGSAKNEAPPTKHIHKGDVLYVGTRAQFVADSGYATVTVSEVTGDTTFTIASAASLTDERLVVRQAVYSTTNSWFKEMTSLSQLITNTGTVQGLAKGDYGWFQSQMRNVNGTMAQTDIMRTLMKCRRYSDNPGSLVLLGNAEQWLRLYSKLATSTTSNIDYSKFDGLLAGGVKGLDVFSPDGKIPFFIDDDVEDGIIYVVDPTAYMLGYTKLFGFAPGGLSMSGYDAIRASSNLSYQFAFYMTAEQVQLNALSSGRIYGITG